MVEHEHIYQNEVEAYDEMIRKQPDLTGYIQEIRPFQGLDVLELGAGTGRFTGSLARQAKSLRCTDLSEAMLSLLARKLEKQGVPRNWSTVVADHRKLPILNHCVDIVISGWSICYVAQTGNERWEDDLEEVISEMKRVVRPGGTIIIFETMGTGEELPAPPQNLTPYFHALIDKYGFKHRWVRADYHFASFEEAKDGTAFFFGEEVVQKIVKNQWSIVPECAGIWWKHL